MKLTFEKEELQLLFGNLSKSCTQIHQVYPTRFEIDVLAMKKKKTKIIQSDQTPVTAKK